MINDQPTVRIKNGADIKCVFWVSDTQIPASHTKKGFSREGDSGISDMNIFSDGIFRLSNEDAWGRTPKERRMQNSRECLKLTSELASRENIRRRDNLMSCTMTTIHISGSRITRHVSISLVVCILYPVTIS
jgi:hypothetical protein